MKKWAILLLLFLLSCAGPVQKLYPDDESKRPIPVYIISHGWHVGIAVESAYIRSHLPGHERIPQTHFLKFGWGDRRYYPNSTAGFGLMLRAAFIPTRSVLHVVGIDRPVDQYFPSSTVVKVMVSEEGAGEMGRFIADQFERTNGTIRVAADGLYPNSTFFEAKDRYYFPRTSNNWTARALRETGYPISPFYAITSGNVIKQASENGEMIQER
ncbi:MAG TPA: DUF2459 domain-containing protein [Balneolaceae bacterium]|nr:DUF2459 domain-containing protein [Balneolaceae bacterium]